MISPEQNTQISELVSTAQTILVIFPSRASVDQVACAVGLYQGLLSLGKNVQLLSPQTDQLEYENLLLPAGISNQLGNKDLYVVFDYTPERVDKVSYNIDEERQKFVLVVQPQKGYKPLDPNTINYEYGGAEADLIFLVGVKDFEELDQLYVGYEKVFQDATTISLNNFAATLAAINLDSSGHSALSEAIVPLLEQMGVAIQDDLATNLLSGIETNTDGFKTPTTSANTFEVVAKLLRNGARRLKRSDKDKKTNQPIKTNTEMFSQKLSSVGRPTKTNLKKKNDEGNPTGGLNYQPSGFSK